MNSIDNLKATIAKKGGLAMQNRFAISGGSAKNLIPDPRDISILCEAVSFPGRQISTIDYIAERQGIKVPYSVINEDVSMTFLLTNDYFIKKMFDAWSTGIFDVEKYRAGYKKDFVTDIVIQQLDQNNVPVYSVRLEGAFPTTISAINLDNNSENTIQKMTVTMSYENYIPEGLVDTAFSTASVALNSLLG